MVRLLVVLVLNLLVPLRNAWRALWWRKGFLVHVTLEDQVPDLPRRLSFWQRRVLGQHAPLSARELAERLERVARDGRCKGLLLTLRGPGMGWATAQGVREDLLRLKAAGKRVVVYLEAVDMAGYYVATAADQVLAPPSLWLHLTGFRAEVLYLKGALDRLGVQVEAHAVSPYKSAAEPYTRTDMSEENRAQLSRLLDGRTRDLSTAVAGGRGKTVEQVLHAMDQAPLAASVAVTQGLLDATAYEDELEERLSGGEGRGGPALLAWDEAAGVLAAQPRRYRGPRVGLVSVTGTIVMGESRALPVGLPALGSRLAGARTVIRALRRAERDKRLAAIVLHVESRGGDAYASDLIWREVQRLARQKPVVAWLGNVAASGGYYVACPAQAIVARPGTVTGSIGVLVMRPVASGLMSLLGVKPAALSRGANAGMLSPAFPVSDRERAALDDLMSTAYGQFLERVREGRGMTAERLEGVAGGRVWLGATAKEHGLVDVLGGFREAVGRAQELAKLPVDPDAPVRLVGGGGAGLAPLRFPRPVADMRAAAGLLDTPRAWALLPWDPP
jgi:protease-4